MEFQYNNHVSAVKLLFTERGRHLLGSEERFKTSHHFYQCIAINTERMFNDQMRFEEVKSYDLLINRMRESGFLLQRKRKHFNQFDNRCETRGIAPKQINFSH